MRDEKPYHRKNVVFRCLIAFLILHAGTHLSLLTQTNLTVSDIFLPTAFALVLVYWMGPKIIIPIVYLNAVVSSFFWGNPIDKWPYYFLYAVPETLYVVFTWALYIKLFKGKYWFPDTRNVVLFFVAGVFIPAFISAILLQTLVYNFPDVSSQQFWKYIASNLLSEFFNTFFFSLPVLYFVTPWLKKLRYLGRLKHSISIPSSLSKKMMLEMATIFSCLFALAFLVDFKDFWFIYGIFPLYIAIRFGFGPTIVTSQYILIIIYILPRLFGSFGQNVVEDYLDVMNIFLGACLLFVFAVITGRVINDLRSADKKLKHQYQELEKTNQELNQFVYRVSHDLSAPLKSVRGLVNLGKLTDRPEEHLEFFERIELSVKRLEDFIAEIMDYFNNKRHRINFSKVNIRQLCDEILDGIPHLIITKPIQVIYQLEEEEVFQDRIRLKIIMKNILYNAIKYQKDRPGHQPIIKVSSRKYGRNFQIEVEDNGLGIQKEQMENIFDIFYRGHVHSTGAGLGLYIAKEVAAKLNGTITVESNYGQGSSFIINLLNHQASMVA